MLGQPPVFHTGDSKHYMRDELAASSIDAIVCDPPYALGLMRQDWDTYSPQEFERWCLGWAVEALRVLKPGGHLVAFGSPRTYHRLACAVEMAGFEIRDTLAWLHGQGWPKAGNLSKTLDRMAGATRPVVGTQHLTGTARAGASGIPTIGADYAVKVTDIPITTPGSPEGLLWDGWSTQLKPANEPILLARKPISERSIAANVLRWGTGALNVGGTRVPTGSTVHEHAPGTGARADGGTFSAMGAPQVTGSPDGRWPANLVVSHTLFCLPGDCTPDCPVAILDSQSVVQVGRSGGTRIAVKAQLASKGYHPNTYGVESRPIGTPHPEHLDNGGVSRYFPVVGYGPGDYVPWLFCAKPSVAERDAGLPGHNAHKTVKPLALMRWLVTLVTPVGGCVLDPFGGSGTTALACVQLGFGSIYSDLDAEFTAIARARVAADAPLWQQLPT